MSSGEAAHLHLRHLNPLPADLGPVLSAYDLVIVPEMNLGQLASVVRARYLVDAVGYNQVRGLPFTSAELVGAIQEGISSVD